MKTPKEALEAIDSAAEQLAKRFRDVQICGELETSLKAMQERMQTEGDLTNPKHVTELSEVNAKLMMLPAKAAKTRELFDSAAKGFAALLDKALYVLKDASAAAAAEVKASLAKALQPYCYPPQVENFTENCGAVTWIANLPALQNKIPEHADFSEQGNVDKLHWAHEEIKTKLRYTLQRGGFLGAFSEQLVK